MVTRLLTPKGLPKDDTTMSLPLFLDRSFRRLLKHLPMPRRAIQRISCLLLIPLILLVPLSLLVLRGTSTISLIAPLSRVTTDETTTLTPCTPHPSTTALTPAQALNLNAALSTAEYLSIHTTCNVTAHHLPPAKHRFYTTDTSILLPRKEFLATGFDERFVNPELLLLIPRLTPLLRHIELAKPRAEAAVHTYFSLAPWNPSDASVYTVLNYSPLSLTLRSAPALHEISVESLQTAQKTSLHDVHKLPWQLLNRLPSGTLPVLIEALDSGKKILVIHVAHGLGNRLRALGSSLAFASATNRVPIVAWPADAHCAVHFDQIFEDSIPFIAHLPGYPFKDARFHDQAWNMWDLYNYMPGEGGIKDERIENTENHIYYKAAYVMRTPLTSWDAANERLRALVPVESIRDRVDQVTERLQKSIGVHVRHLSTDKDIGGVDPVGEYGDFDTRVIGYFRSACSPAVFVAELRKMKSETGLTDVFVAADSPQWRKDIANEIEGVWGMEGCEGRCEIHAMIDLLALARCPTVLGSFWSSFSEAIQRFSGEKIRLAGVDFGRGAAGFGKDVEETAADIVSKRLAAGN